MNIKVTVNAACAEYDNKKMKVGPSIALAEVGHLDLNKQLVQDGKKLENKIR